MGEAVRLLLPLCADSVGAWMFRQIPAQSGKASEATPECHEYGATEDTAQHTLEECSTWSQPRQTLRAVIGQDPSLPG